MEQGGPLEEIAPDLFVHEGRKRFLGFVIPRCMTIVRLRDPASDSRELVVHSPNALDPALKEAIDELGDVRVIIAPNAMHGFAVDQWAARWPEARVLVAPNFPARHPGLRFDRVLIDGPEPEWRGELDQAIVAGNPFLHEVVFLHRASRTLIVTDLIENFRREHLSMAGRIAARLIGIFGRPVPSPEHAMYTDDPEAASESLSRIAGWDFERIILAHGARIEDDAKAALSAVTEELLTKVRSRSRGRRRLYLWMARRQ